MAVNKERFKRRTRAYAIRVLKLVDALPKTGPANLIGRQLVRSATSVGANYRAACRARSRAEFISKLGTVEEECDESIYWMELLGETRIIPSSRLVDLMAEANELLAMVVSSIKTSRRRNQSAIRNPKSQIYRRVQC